MDPRIPFTQNPSGQTFAMGQRYPSLEAAEKAVDEIIARREAIAGRPLSARELREGGIAHADPRSERERLADAQWQPKLPRAPKVDDNPFRQSEDDDDDDISARERIRRKAEREWDAKKEREADRTSPQRLAAIKEATETLELLRYEPTATQREIDQAQRLLQQAEIGDLAHYRAMRDAINDSRIARYGDEATKAQERLAQAQAEYHASQQRINKLRPPQQEPSKPEPEPIRGFVKVDYSEAAGGGSVILEYQGDDVVARHDPASCDASIVAQAK